MKENQKLFEKLSFLEKNFDFTLKNLDKVNEALSVRTSHIEPHKNAKNVASSKNKLVFNKETEYEEVLYL